MSEHGLETIGASFSTGRRPCLRLENVTRRLSERAGVFDVSLEVNASEVVSVIGRTGAGKSTLLRMIAGLERIDSGAIELEGRNLVEVAPHERGVSMIFQKDLFYPGRLLEADWREAEARGVFGIWKMKGIKATELLEQLELEPALLRQKPETFSGGQARRAGLLRALLQDRPILLADEPLNGLDLATRDRVSRVLWRFVKATGKAMIIVAHEPTDALGIADRIAVMQAGKLLQVDSAESVIGDPQHLEVISLLAFPPWNTLPDRGDGRVGLIAPKFFTLNELSDSLACGIRVRRLRDRWTQEGVYSEWVAADSSEVYWTKACSQHLEDAVLTWHEAGVRWFDSVSGELAQK